MNYNKKTHRKNLNIIPLTIILMFIAFTLFAIAAPKGENIEYYAYLVKSGDTLWDISSEFKKENEDPRNYIDMIVKHNQLASLNIMPGQIISLPIYK